MERAPHGRRLETARWWSSPDERTIMPRPIICGLDDSAEALAAARLAAMLARCVDAPLVLVHAIPAVYANDGWMVLGAFPDGALYDGQERERRKGDALLQGVIGRLHLGDEMQILLPVGDAATALLAAAAAARARALIVGARGHGRVHRAVLGSVSGRVTASAPCPVVVVPHDMANDLPLMDGPILCGVDGSAHAERGAAAAAAAAERLGRELVLVHVLPSALAAVPVGGAGAAVESTALEEAARKDAWALLAATAGRVRVPARLITERATGTIASTLSELARREGATCLTIGSRGRGPVRSALLGSVSASAAVQSPCPVVVVPPEATRAPSAEPRAAAYHRLHGMRT
jgi:nucleotide-binding universal stress UspA family protein